MSTFQHPGRERSSTACVSVQVNIVSRQYLLLNRLLVKRSQGSARRGSVNRSCERTPQLVSSVEMRFMLVVRLCELNSAYSWQFMLERALARDNEKSTGMSPAVFCGDLERRILRLCHGRGYGITGPRLRLRGSVVDLATSG